MLLFDLHTGSQETGKWKWSEVAQSCPTLCDPVDCSPPRSSVHGIFQARVLKWIAVSFSRGFSRPRDRSQFSHIISKMLYHLSHQGNPTGRRQVRWSGIPISLRIFHSLLWCTESKALAYSGKQNRCFSGISLPFLCDPPNVGNLISGSSAFSKPTLCS